MAVCGNTLVSMPSDLTSASVPALIERVNLHALAAIEGQGAQVVARRPC